MSRNARTQPPHAPERRRRPLWRAFVRVFAIALVVLVAARIALPHAVFWYVNRTLDNLQGYHAHIADLDINLWRGAYEIEGLSIEREVGPERTPLLAVAKADLAIDWPGLLRGQLIGRATLHRPVVHIVVAEDPTRSKTGERADWWAALEQLFPFQIEKLIVMDGRVHYADRRSDPALDLWLGDLYVDARNLTNQADLAEKLPSTIELAARPFGRGELVAKTEFSPFAEPPVFQLDAVARELSMLDLNDFVASWVDADAEAGELEIDIELAARDGLAEGYVKLLLDGLRLASFGEIDDPTEALQFAWESLVQLGAEILENQPHDRLALRIPLRGELTQPAPDAWAAVGSLLENAYLSAIDRGLDRRKSAGDISPASEAERHDT